MSYLVLARRLRPQTFDEVIGQEHVTRTLKNALTSGRLAHAFLFAGTRGVGKTSVARILAKAVNCQGPAEEAPCNKCPSCLEINEGRSVDVQEIDGASNRGIDEVRELRENVRYLPAGARYKVYIIDEVHMLTGPAFNALLKTLEEPPDFVIFIFATTEVHKVPATILSRCQRYDFRLVPTGLIAKYIRTICQNESIDLDEAAAALLARAAKGSIRDGLSLLDQAISYTGQQVSEADVAQILGLVDPRLVWQTARAVLQGQTGAVLESIDQVVVQGYDPPTFFQELMAHFRNLIVLKVEPEAASEALGLRPDEMEELKRQAGEASAETLQLCLQGLLEAERLLRASSQPRFALELALLRLCAMVPVVGLDEILTKLDRVKEMLAQPGQAAEPAPARPSRPEDDQDEDEPVEAEPGPGSPPRSPVADWPAFQAALKSSDARLAAYLNGTKAQALKGSRLVLAQVSGFDFLADAERRQSLERAVSQFFGRPLKLELNLQPAPNLNHNGRSNNDLNREALEDPLVKAAADMFEGQPVAIKPLDG